MRTSPLTTAARTLAAGSRATFCIDEMNLIAPILSIAALLGIAGGCAPTSTMQPFWWTTPSLTPDGKSVVFVSTHHSAIKPYQEYGAVSVTAFDATDSRKLTQSNQCELWPAWATDGKAIGFFRARYVRPYSTGGYTWKGWDVFISSFDGRIERRLTNCDFWECAGLTLSPDGNSVLYSSLQNSFPKDSYYQIFSVNSMGLLPDEKKYVSGKVVLAGQKDYLCPCYSPTGDFIVFVTRTKRTGTLLERLGRSTLLQWELCKMNPDFTGIRVLLKSTSPIASPQISDDGKTILVWRGLDVARSALRGKRADLVAMDNDGGNIRNVQNHSLQRIVTNRAKR